MAPDRGSSTLDASQSSQYQAISAENDGSSEHEDIDGPVSNDDQTYAQETRQRSDTRKFLAEQADQGQNFTVRGVVVGLAIGVIICFSNMYFGLQTGWVSGMAMPSALIGFAVFKSIARYIDYPFTPVENVLVQTVAGALGTMPLGCGFVGVMPALNYLLKPEENGPLVLGTGKLIIWSLGICFFGVVLAVPLRKEVIIREKLKFPSGTATALMIGVLHESTDDAENIRQTSGLDTVGRRSQDELRSSSLSGVTPSGAGNGRVASTTFPGAGESGGQGPETDRRSDWKTKIRLLVIAFGMSSVYVCIVTRYKFVITKLIGTDARIVLYPSIARSSNIWTASGHQLAVDAEPIARIRWSRHNHGPSNYHPHASRRHHRLGYPLPSSEASRLGIRPCRRLGNWEQRLDRMGQLGRHARRLDRQLSLADSPALNPPRTTIRRRDSDPNQKRQPIANVPPTSEGRLHRSDSYRNPRSHPPLLLRSP